MNDKRIRVEITDATEFHCFRMVLKSLVFGEGSEAEDGHEIEIMLHASALVDLIHECSTALGDWQRATTEMRSSR